MKKIVLLLLSCWLFMGLAQAKVLTGIEVLKRQDFKILAGKRAGIKEYILSKDNKKDIQEIKEEYLKGLTFHYVTDMEEVVRLAITSQDAKHKKVFTFE